MINSRRMGLAGHMACIGKMRNVQKILVGKAERKTPLGGQHSRGNNIKMELKEKGCDWVHVEQGRDWWWALVNMVINLHVL
jgi:hypothetical protein